MPKRKPCPYCRFGLAPTGYVELENLKMYYCLRCHKTLLFRNEKLYKELEDKIK